MSRCRDTPHVVLAEHIVRAIQTLSGHRTEFDLVFIYVPERWQPGFAGGAGDDFDLHDHIKAFAAGAGIPVQLVREGRAISYDCQASVMWRIGLAIYAKAGGVPWKLAEADPETAYIGISYSVRGAASELPRFVTCCSQVFDSDGAGLEFVAYDAREVDVQQDNPFLSQNEMFRVMTRSMDLYRRRHAGRSPRRVMVHKSTEFKREERDGCMEALRVCEAVDLVQVVEHVDWRGSPHRRTGKCQRQSRGVSRTAGDGPPGRRPRGAALEPWRCKGGHGAVVLPGQPEHSPTATPGSTCWPRVVGRHGASHSGAIEDELEQRRVVRPVAGHDELREGAVQSR